MQNQIMHHWNHQLKCQLPRTMRAWLFAAITCAMLISPFTAQKVQAADYAIDTSGSALSGLWYKPSESGWGISLTQQGPIIFAAWYAYEANGAPIWYVITRCEIVANGCNGDIYRVTGGTKPTIAWAGANRTATKIGSGGFTFTDVNSGVFSYELGGVSTSRGITRQLFATGASAPSVDYTGLWWNPGESGWGMSITQQFSTIFAAWFTYDDLGAPIWYTASNCVMTANRCSGDLYYITGGTPPTLAWNGPVRTILKVGVLDINFASVNSASISYTINGVSGTRLISRQVFYSAPSLASAPVIGTATVGTTASNNSAAISFSAPSTNGGAAISRYTASCSAGSAVIRASGSASPITVIGLTAGTAYSCVVTATNAAGESAASGSVSVTLSTAVSPAASAFKGQVWADNWFALYLGDTQIAEDAVPVTTERSFNSETFNFSARYPLALNFIIKDYKQNDSGLEYIGLVNQQIGDGGFIMQITDTTLNKVVAVSSSAFKCLVIHKAPLNPSCERDANPLASCQSRIMGEPVGWKSASYSASTWETPLEYSAAQIGVKEGYFDIAWDLAAKLIWTADLKADNTLLCKATIAAPSATAIPAAPTQLLASAGDNRVSLAFTAPLASSGLPVSSYTGACVNGASTLAVSSAASPIVITGLSAGLLYACTVMANNSAGSSAPSSSVGVTATGASTNCLNVRNSTESSSTGLATVSCDSSYAYVSSNGLATHAMMNGITASNLQMPLAQNFYGANAWKIPLNPTIAANTTTAVDGPIGIAINGVPIFNPCKQGGCQNGDTKVLGELDSCNGHAGRADDYHYHAAPICMMASKPANYWDTHPLGWALDGFAIFGYNDASGNIATRDGLCGGNTSPVSNAPAGYSYHVTEASPYVLSCFRGTPSPDLRGQGAKYFPIRQPPVTPFAVSNMSLSTDASDGYQVLQFSTARAFVSTATGADSYNNAPGSYKIRYQQLTGTALTAVLAQAQNSGKSVCWNFQFLSSAGATTQPTISYCR